MFSLISERKLGDRRRFEPSGRPQHSLVEPPRPGGFRMTLTNCWGSGACHQPTAGLPRGLGLQTESQWAVLQGVVSNIAGARREIGGPLHADTVVVLTINYAD